MIYYLATHYTFYIKIWPSLDQLFQQIDKPGGRLLVTEEYVHKFTYDLICWLGVIIG